MSMRVNRSYYEGIIYEQINRLDRGRSNSIDERFVNDVFEESIVFHYDLMPALKRVFDLQDCTWKHNVSDEDLKIIKGFIEREFSNDLQ